LLILAVGLVFAGVTSAQNMSDTEQITIIDKSRDREIPTIVYLPATGDNCSPDNLCKVAMLSSGYGILNTEYSFIAVTLNRMGFLVAAVQHELPNDPELSSTQPYITTRMSNWSRGVENLRVAREQLKLQYAEYNWNRLLLIGHSNGGDISSLYARDNEQLVSNLVTIDHRRMPLPLNRSTKVLSIRGSDFEADLGVLPSALDQEKYDVELVEIPGARHDNMYDGGSAELKAKIINLIESFLDSE